jgi:hypothetical protein
LLDLGRQLGWFDPVMLAGRRRYLEQLTTVLLVVRDSASGKRRDVDIRAEGNWVRPRM